MTLHAETEEKLYFLDACCLINLFASGRAGEILEALPQRFAVARYVVEEEALGIRPDPGDAPSTADPGVNRTSLRPLIVGMAEEGILDLADISTVEEETELVRFAAQLDDGEAHTLALAIVRGAGVATDDRKAIRVLERIDREYGRETAVLRTSELLFFWARLKKVREAELVEIVASIARRASFFPPKRDPQFERWMELLHGVHRSSNSEAKGRATIRGSSRS